MLVALAREQPQGSPGRVWTMLWQRWLLETIFFRMLEGETPLPEIFFVDA